MPEYNFGLTGALKNAIDWASRSPNAFADKPAAMLSAAGGGGGAKAQYHLRQVGVFLDLHFINKPEVQIQAFAPGNCDLATGELVSPEARARVAAATTALVAWTERLRAK